MLTREFSLHCGSLDYREGVMNNGAALSELVASHTTTGEENCPCRDRWLRRNAITIQAIVRGHLARLSYPLQAMYTAIRFLQKISKGYLARLYVKRIR